MEDGDKTYSSSITSCCNPFSVTTAAAKSTFTTDNTYGLCVVINAILCSEPLFKAFAMKPYILFFIVAIK